MLLSLDWLKEFVDIPVPVHEFAHRMTMSGFEVESIDEIGSQWDNILVAEVLESSQHPDADKLTVNTVSTGEQTLQVICGAPNVRAGHKVALALPGAKFPSGLVIKRSKIRGQVSEGMLCSADELCIGDPDGGILILDNDSSVGTLLADALDLRDTVIDFDITPNRSDCLSVIGMAREVAAIFPQTMRTSSPTLPETGPSIADVIHVDIQSPDSCPRYCAGYAYDIKIEPSPLWMRQRLSNCGIRPINNIVDITNYVLLEFGQPLHAFDYHDLKEAKIIVRDALTDETFTTLDSVEHTMPCGTLMICDAERPRALAGIMGGLDSSIAGETNTVLLESAYFKPSSIATTGRALSIKTEASLRFEKGVDPAGVIPALKRAEYLILELKAGKIASGLMDCHPAPLPEPLSIDVSIKSVNRMLGLSLDAESITGHLTGLHMCVTPKDPDTLTVIPPTHRYDIGSYIDLVEEIARMNGYDSIPVTYPLVNLVSGVPNLDRNVASQARMLLASSGFSEVVNFSFQDPELLTTLRFKDDDERNDPVQLLNPLSAAQSVMRTTVLGSLLQNLQHNLNANRCAALAIFEISNVFFKIADGKIREDRKLAGLIYGEKSTNTWAYSNRAADIFDIKGCVETLFSGLNIVAYHFETDCNEPYLAPQTGIQVFIGDTYCGSCGTLHPDISEAFDAQGPVHVFELDFNQICAYYSSRKTYTSFSRFPAMHRDLALIVDQSVTSAEVLDAIKAYKNKLLRQWNIFDFYQGGSIPDGKKSIAFRLTFQSDERTLTDKEVNKIHDKLLASLRDKLGVELR